MTQLATPRHSTVRTSHAQAAVSNKLTAIAAVLRLGAAYKMSTDVSVSVPGDAELAASVCVTGKSHHRKQSTFVGSARNLLKLISAAHKHHATYATAQ